MTALFALLLPFFLQAGGFDQGNSGNVMSCPGAVQDPLFVNGHAVLDVLEGRRLERFGYRRLVSLRGTGFETAVRRAIHASFGGTERGERYLRWFRRWNREAIFVPRLPLSAFSGRRGIIESGCGLRQVIVQRIGWPRRMPETPARLVISAEMWRQLAADQKAALVIHEYILREALILHGPCALAGVRPATAFALSDQALRLSAQDRGNGLAERLRCEPRSPDTN